MEKLRHKLTDKDVENRSANCSVCGPVKIVKVGQGYTCANRKAASHQRWAEANPDKLRANRQTKSEHYLTDRDVVALTGECAVCGPVDILPYGRGYACGNRARELRGAQQAAPQSWCRECWAEMEDQPGRRRIALRADGSCPRHDDPTLTLTQQTIADRLNRDEMRDTFDEVGPGFHIIGEWDDPYAMPGYESAVPGWHTLGASA